jgi:signal transduction histidine kinase
MHPTTTLESSSPPADFAAAVEVAKLRALYNFAYGLSHEINNPLANIATRAQTLLVDETDPERRRKLATIVQQAFRAHEMIADLMLFAHPPKPQPREVDLAQLVDKVLAEVQEQAREQETTLLRTGDTTPLLATVDPTQIAVALKAIVQNALEAVQQCGRVEVSAELGAGNAEQSSIPPPHFSLFDAATLRSNFRAPSFVLTVTDTGPGIPPEIRPQIFDPFFSGREAGRGLGLGLCKAWRIVEMHGGTIEVDSNPAAGAMFRIILPETSRT